MRLPTYAMLLTWNFYYGVADPRYQANDFWFCFVIKWDLHCLGSCNEYLYGTEELFRQYFDIELMENIIFHTQYIKMEIRSLHKGVTKSFHYEAIFYLFHHKNGLFGIFTYQISEERGRGIDTIEDWKGSVFLMLFIFEPTGWNLTFKTGSQLKG